MGFNPEFELIFKDLIGSCVEIAQNVYDAVKKNLGTTMDTISIWYL